MKKCVLGGFIQEEMEVIQRSLEGDEISSFEFGIEDSQRTIQDIMDNPNQKGKRERFSLRLMLFEGLEQKSIQRVYDKLIEQGVKPGWIIAVKTEHNASWMLKDLVEELRKEQEWFVKREKLQEKIQELNQMPLQELTEEEKAQLMEIYMVFQNATQEISMDQLLEKVTGMIDRLSNF